MSITSSTCRAGVAAFAVTGAIAVGLAAPSAYATTPSDDLQPTIDTLLNEMATAVAVDTAYFDTTPANEARLPEALQTLMYKNLATLLNQQSTVPYATRQPEMVAGPMANSRQFLGANNPDTIYYTQTIDPHATNVVTLDPGPGTVDATFTIANLSVTTPNAYTNVRLADLEPNADGTYTIYVSPTKPEGAVNWIPSITTDANGNELVGNTVAVRSTLGDWAAPPASLTFENLDGTLPTSANPGVSSTGLSDDAIGGLLGELAATTQISNGIWAVYYGDLIGRARRTASPRLPAPSAPARCPVRRPRSGGSTWHPARR